MTTNRAYYGVVELDIVKSSLGSFIDEVGIVVELQGGELYFFYTADGEHWRWSYDPDDDDEYQSIYMRLRWVWSNDKAFAAVATPGVKNIRESLRRLHLLSPRRRRRRHQTNDGTANPDWDFLHSH